MLRRSLAVFVTLALFVVCFDALRLRSQSFWRAAIVAVSQGRRENDDDSSLEVPPRVYRPWGPRELPCFDDVMGSPKPFRRNIYHDKQSTQKGFLYMRPPKCASTTVAGVNLRIARNVARLRRYSLKKAPVCDMSFGHGGTKKARRFSGRVYDQSYLWTIIREPTARHVSFYWFWAVSALGMEHSDDAFQAFLMEQYPDYYYYFLSPRYDPQASRSDSNNSTLNKTEIIDEANYILNEYDFIGVTERLDESLVVLMMLLDLPMADILYYTVKAADNLYYGPTTNNTCIRLTPAKVSDSLKDFFDTDTWKARVYSDELLYRAAEASLDLTIDSLGRQRVQTKVAKFQRAQAAVVEQCRGKIRMECEAEGDPPRTDIDCMDHDLGCGMECLDQVATELNLWGPVRYRI